MAFPLKDSLLVPYSINFNNVLSAGTGTEYGLSEEQILAYSAAHTPYVSSVSTLNVARAQGTQSKIQRAARDTARDNLLTIGRHLYSSVASNTTISNVAKIALGVHVRDGNTPHPIIEVSPTVVLGTVESRKVSMRIFDPISESKRAKAPGAVAANLWTFVGEDYPSDPSAWAFQGAATTFSHKITFPSSIPGGSRVWVMAAWLNSRQLAGPPSMPVSTYLQGGGTGAVQSARSDSDLKIAA